MLPNFLPASANQIRDPQTIAFLQQLQRQTVQVAFQADAPQGMTSIETALVQCSPAELRSTVPPFPIPPFLCLHGFDSSLLEFRRLLPLLSFDRTTWAIDLYGSGFTAYSKAVPVNPQTICLHLHRTIATWIRQPVILIGASLGGAVAIDFALHYPDWVKAIVLIDSVGFSGSFPIGQFLPLPLIQLGIRWLQFRKQAALTAAAPFSAIFSPLLPILPPEFPAGFSKQLADDLRCSLLHQEMPEWSEAVLSFTQSGGYGEMSRQIAAIQQPTLILWGRNDTILGTTDAEKFKQAISGSQLAWIEKAGHAPHLEQPQSVADRIQTFCQTQAI